MLPINLKAPLIVVKKPIYYRYLDGSKTIEYRLHRKPFTRGAFWPGRIVRLAYNYNIKINPSRLARVVAFNVATAGDIGKAIDLASDYGELDPATEIALIELTLLPE